MKSAFNYLKNNALLIGGFIILLIALFEYFKSLLNSKNIGFDDYEVTLDAKGASISDDKSKRLADILHVAMGSMGTDFEAIKICLDGLTAPDFSKVHNSFGTRGYIDIIGVGTNVPTALKFNLTQWLESELTNSQKRELKRLHPAIF